MQHPVKDEQKGTCLIICPRLQSNCHPLILDGCIAVMLLPIMNDTNVIANSIYKSYFNPMFCAQLAITFVSFYFYTFTVLVLLVYVKRLPV